MVSKRARKSKAGSVQGCGTEPATPKLQADAVRRPDGRKCTTCTRKDSDADPIAKAVDGATVV
eukprot:1985772-Lingulodinium_polyedra.AAC.1